MIIIHAVQKLLTIARTEASLFISKPSNNQELHSWYAKLISTSFRGKLIVMYVHEPSLLVVLTRGKTVKGTIAEFSARLEGVLKRNHFKKDFIKHEIAMVQEGYVISKTDSRSMLGSMNAITASIESRCSTYTDYESIPMDHIEDSFINWITRDITKPNQFRLLRDFWKEKGVLDR